MEAKYTLKEVAESRIEFIESYQRIDCNDCVSLSLDAYFNEQDLSKMKQYCFILTRILEKDCHWRNKEAPQVQQHALHLESHIHFSVALLSDNLSLLKRLQALRYNNREKEFKQGWIFSYCMQCILNEDWKELDRIQEMALRFPKRDQPKYQLMFPIWEALKQKDIDKTVLSIQQLLKPINHRKFNDWPTWSELISSPALGYAKLAWLRGMEINFNHPLIPQEILPYQPLEFYNDEHEYIKLYPG